MLLSCVIKSVLIYGEGYWISGWSFGWKQWRKYLFSSCWSWGPVGKWGEMWVHFRKLRDGYALHFIFLYLLTELGGKESKTEI